MTGNSSECGCQSCVAFQIENIPNRTTDGLQSWEVDFEQNNCQTRHHRTEIQYALEILTMTQSQSSP